jgi:NlpC/P60 family putative phage cell wall peptidase
VRGVWRALYGPEPETVPAYTPDWAEALGCETLAEAAARHLAPVEVGSAGSGDVLLFRLRPDLPARHAGVFVSPDGLIHAYSGACVAETPLGPWWRRRIAYAFRFPGVRD